MHAPDPGSPEREGDRVRSAAVIPASLPFLFPPLSLPFNIIYQFETLQGWPYAARFLSLVSRCAVSGNSFVHPSPFPFSPLCFHLTCFPEPRFSMPNIFMHIGGWLLACACIVSVHAMPTPLSAWSSPVSSSPGLLSRTPPAFVQETVVLASTKTRALIGCLLSLFVVGIVAGVVTLWLCWEKGWVCCGWRDSFDEEYQVR